MNGKLMRENGKENIFECVWLGGFGWVRRKENKW